MKKFILSCLVVSLSIPTVQTLAKTGIFNLQANYNNIKITLDGNPVNTSNEPFIYNGVTYLPVRDVSEAVGLDVEWDSNSKTVKLSSKTNISTNNVETSTNNVEIKTSYVGNTDNQKLHISSCRYVDKMLPENIVQFDSRDSAISSGYVDLCEVCNP